MFNNLNFIPSESVCGVHGKMRYNLQVFFHHKTKSVRGVRGYFRHTGIYRERYDPYAVMSMSR